MHNLMILNGQASMFYIDETPWHGLAKMESLLEYKDTSTDSIFYLGLGIVVLLATYYFLKKRKIRASGRHKKDDENRFPSGNGTIKYRDS